MGIKVSTVTIFWSKSWLIWFVGKCWRRQRWERQAILLRNVSLRLSFIFLTSRYLSHTNRATSLTLCPLSLKSFQFSLKSYHHLSHILHHTLSGYLLLTFFVNITPPSEFSKKWHCSVCGGRSACRTHCGGETVIYIYILMGWDLLWVPLHLDFAAISFSEILNYEKKFWIIFPQNISVIDCQWFAKEIDTKSQVLVAYFVVRLRRGNSMAENWQ